MFLKPQILYKSHSLLEDQKWQYVPAWLRPSGNVGTRGWSAMFVALSSQISEGF